MRVSVIEFNVKKSKLKVIFQLCFIEISIWNIQFQSYRNKTESVFFFFFSFYMQLHAKVTQVGTWNAKNSVYISCKVILINIRRKANATQYLSIRPIPINIERKTDSYINI